MGIPTILRANIDDTDIADTTSGNVLVSNGTSFVTATMSGDATIASGGALTIASTSIEAGMLGANLATGFINLDLHTLREIASNDYQALGATEGGHLATDSVPDLYRVNGATDKAAKVEWKATETDEVQFAPVAIPPDYDNTADTMSVHCIWTKGSNTDTSMVVDVQVFSGFGDTEMGGNTAAINVAADTVFESSVALTGANVGAHPGFLNIILVPGAHANDVLRLHAAWIEYPRKT